MYPSIHTFVCTRTNNVSQSIGIWVRRLPQIRPTRTRTVVLLYRRQQGRFPQKTKTEGMTAVLLLQLMQCRLWVCLHSMTVGRNVDPVVYETLQQCYSKPTEQLNNIIAGPTRKGKINDTQDTSFPNFLPLMRVQPMCAPRKARPLQRLSLIHI